MGDLEERKAAVAGVFDRAAEGYGVGRIDFFDPAGRDLVRVAAPQPGERVLDLGCGRGASAVPAAHAVGERGEVLGVDLAPRMVELLRERAAAERLDWVHAEVGDAADPPAEPGRWDLLLASLVLFFLPDVHDALRRYRSLLAPGGRLAFSWFGPEDPRWDAVYEAMLAELPETERGARRPGDDCFSSTALMTEALRAAGFEEVATHEVVMEVAVPDGEAWWEHQWTHGRRAFMETLRDRDLLEATRAGVVPAVEALREPDGTLAWRPTLRHTVAS